MEKVGEIMTKNVITVRENDTLLRAAEVLKENRVAGAPVLNEQDELVGIISETDVLKIMDYFPWDSLTSLLQPFSCSISQCPALHHAPQ